MKTSLFLSWLPVAIIIIAICGLIFLVVQQNYRQSSFDPQIQISEDIATALVKGQDATTLVPATPVDLAKSLATFIIIYNDAGQPSTSSASLDGRTPNPPTGVLEYTKAHQQHRLTWQPQSGIRLATVITYYTGTKSGYVLVGRSLREVESRIKQLEIQVALILVATLISSLAATMIFNRPRG